ncbi:MAG: hypothetical protein PWQ70_1887 [Clostridiales bacterium]|jgi:hypothetical protein|nr:hypothetical protein [Clostridiales bacterium]
MNINDILDYLIRIGEAKAKLMDDILDITQKQSLNIGEEHIDVLSDLIQQKQKCIDKINVLNKEFIEKYDDIKQNLNVASLAEINSNEYPSVIKLKTTIQSIDKVVQQIQQLEKINNKKMLDALGAVKEQITNIKNSRKVNAVYNQGMPIYVGVFIDKKK